METGGEVKLEPHDLKQLCPKSPRKVHVLVTHDRPKQASILDYMLEEQMSGLLDGAFFGCECKVGILGVSIYYY